MKNEPVSCFVGRFFFFGLFVLHFFSPTHSRAPLVGPRDGAGVRLELYQALPRRVRGRVRRHLRACEYVFPVHLVSALDCKQQSSHATPPTPLLPCLLFFFSSHFRTQSLFTLNPERDRERGRSQLRPGGLCRVSTLRYERRHRLPGTL